MNINNENDNENDNENNLSFDNKIQNSNDFIIKEKNTSSKRTIVFLSILCFVLFLAGLVVGPIILKATSKNIEDGSFMYNILKNAGYIEEQKKVPVVEEKPNEIEKNKYYFSTMSNGYYYYYMIDDNGVYNYYYTKEKDMNNYSTDSNGTYVGSAYQVSSPDLVSPKIVIRDDREITIRVGEKLRDIDYYAYDDVDGTITDKVTKGGDVDITKPGKYILVLSVSDTAGNTASEIITVIVEE